jgi:hypothetical protein
VYYIRRIQTVQSTSDLAQVPQQEMERYEKIAAQTKIQGLDAQLKIILS